MEGRRAGKGGGEGTKRSPMVDQSTHTSERSEGRLDGGMAAVGHLRQGGGRKEERGKREEA